MLELESYCKKQDYRVEMLIQAAIRFRANRLRRRISDLNVTADEVGRVMQAIQYRLALDERQKVVESYLYANDLDKWFQGVKEAAPAEQAKEPAADGPADGRGYRPKQDIIDLIVAKNGTFRGWKLTAQIELDTIQKQTGSGREQLDKKTACDIFYRAYEPQFRAYKRTSEQVYDALRKSP